MGNVSGRSRLCGRKFFAAIYHYDRLYRMAKRHAGTHNLVTSEAAIKLSNALLRTELPADLNLAAKLMEETVETTSRLLPSGDFRHAVIDALMGEIALRKRNYLLARELLQRASMSSMQHRESARVVKFSCSNCSSRPARKQAGRSKEEAVRCRINQIEMAQLVAVDYELLN